MILKLWLSFIFLFLLGGLGVWFLTKNKNINYKKDTLGKYWVYLLLSVIMFMTSMYSSYYYIICVIISVIGLFEIYSLSLPRTTKYLSIALYIPLALSFLCFSYISNPIQASLLLCLVLAFDGFSQIFGNAIGKNPIAKSISPNKTWEGFSGGALCVILGYLFLTEFNINISRLMMIILLVSAALTGDLMASYLKRKSNIKDFNNLIPFHGGVLDRFDSLILSSAIATPFYLIGITI